MQKAYDICLAEDKDLDKGFKKEFADCEPHLDQLYKLYKKRPRCARYVSSSLDPLYLSNSLDPLYLSSLLDPLYLSSYIVPLRVLCALYRGQRLKAGESGMQHDPSSSNPFAHRPMSALGGKKAGGDLMAELDHPSNIPEGVDRHAWDHFVKTRRRKVESEQKVSACNMATSNMATSNMATYHQGKQVL